MYIIKSFIRTFRSLFSLISPQTVINPLIKDRGGFFILITKNYYVSNVNLYYQTCLENNILLVFQFELLEFSCLEKNSVEVWCMFEKSEVFMSSFTAVNEEVFFSRIGVSKVISLSLTSVINNNEWSLLY